MAIPVTTFYYPLIVIFLIVLVYVLRKNLRHSNERIRDITREHLTERRRLREERERRMELNDEEKVDRREFILASVDVKEIVSNDANQITPKQIKLRDIQKLHDENMYTTCTTNSNSEDNNDFNIVQQLIRSLNDSCHSLPKVFTTESKNSNANHHTHHHDTTTTTITNVATGQDETLLEQGDLVEDDHHHGENNNNDNFYQLIQSLHDDSSSDSISKVFTTEINDSTNHTQNVTISSDGDDDPYEDEECPKLPTCSTNATDPTISSTLSTPSIPNIPSMSSISSIFNNEEDKDEEINQVTAVCPICLDTYQIGDDVIFSRNKDCSHTFHLNCMIDWLMMPSTVKDRDRSNNHDGNREKGDEGRCRDDCPLCRMDYLKETTKVVETDDFSTQQITNF